MSTAVHRATKDVAPSEAPRNGALSGRDLLSRLPTEDVPTPLGEVTVHGLGASQMVEFGPRARALPEGNEEATLLFMIEVAAAGLDLDIADAGRLPPPVIVPLFKAIVRLSGLSEEAVEEAVEGLKALPNDES